MRLLFYVVFSCVLIMNAYADDAPKEIYLMIGQSNMAGRGEVTEEIKAPLNGVMLLTKEGLWEPARNPLNRHSTIRKGLKMQKLGPGYGFALEMRTQRPTVTIGLVVNARGGSNIDQWREGSSFFEQAVKRGQQAIKTGGTLKGICWHQGESNAEDKEYLTKLTSLVTAFRTTFENQALPFVVGETCKAESERPVNTWLRKLPETLRYTACISSDNLAAFDGNTHFDGESQLELGRRYAAAMLELIKQSQHADKTHVQD